MLAVDPVASGHGIGTALVEQCIARAHEAGRPRLVLLTRRSMHVAQRIYDRLGFVRAPERDEPLPSGDGLLGYVLALPRT